jgi:LiaI-LiaF-like transmembrane region
MEQNATPASGPAGSGMTPGPAAPGTGGPPGAGETSRRRYRYRSLFWPIILIGVGVVWLLYNLDVISSANLEVLGLVWPVLVIGIGVDLIVGHRSPGAGALVGVITVGVVIILMLAGPGFGWTGTTDLTTETFTTPVGEATQAQVEIDLSGYSGNIHALSSATGAERPLVQAVVTHRGEVEFNTAGTTTKTVTLKSTGDWRWWQRIGNDTAETWDIGLDSATPLALTMRGSSGSSTIDLSGLKALRTLGVDSSSGDSEVILPTPDPVSSYLMDLTLHSSSGRMDVVGPDGAAFTGRVEMSSGDTRVTLGKDSTADVRFQGSSGQFVLTVAPGQALRVEVQSISSGDVKLPDGLTRVSGDGEEGVWQTPGYDSAAFKVNVVVEHMSSGTVKIQAQG